jgi:hypothetical protein
MCVLTHENGDKQVMFNKQILSLLAMFSVSEMVMAKLTKREHAVNRLANARAACEQVASEDMGKDKTNRFLFVASFVECVEHDLMDAGDDEALALWLGDKKALSK